MPRAVSLLCNESCIWGMLIAVRCLLSAVSFHSRFTIHGFPLALSTSRFPVPDSPFPGSRLPAVCHKNKKSPTLDGSAFSCPINVSRFTALKLFAVRLTLGIRNVSPPNDSGRLILDFHVPMILGQLFIRVEGLMGQKAEGITYGTHRFRAGRAELLTQFEGRPLATLLQLVKSSLRSRPPPAESTFRQKRARFQSC